MKTDFQTRLQKNSSNNIQALTSELKLPTNHIEFLSGPCGSGKTHALLQNIKLNPDEKYFIVVPTKILCLEYENNLKKLGVSNVHILDKNHHDKVEEKLIDVFITNSKHDMGCVIVTTLYMFNLINCYCNNLFCEVFWY